MAGINILFVVLSLNIGGLEVLLLEFLKKLDRNRFNPHVCVLSEEGELIPEFNHIGVIIHRLAKKRGIDFSLPFKMRKILKEFNIKIIHSHNSTPWIYSACAVLMLKKRCLIHTKHSNLNITQKRLMKAEYYAAKATDCIIADACDVRDFMIQKQNIHMEKIKLIYNGIDINKFQMNYTAGNNRKKKKIGIVGRLVPIKDHKTLIDAINIIVRKNKDIELIIIGDGPLKKELVDYVQEKGLSQSVVFTGVRRDIPEIMKQLDVFVLCSLDEGMSIVLLEAMASGVPVVATNVGGNSEIVVDNETGYLVPSRNPELLAQKIGILISDNNLATIFGKNAQRRVSENFSIENMAASYEALYEKVLLK